MQVSQATKAEHSAPCMASGAFVIPNPWDAGTARILTHLGFEALTTTSAGLAFTLGRADGAGLVTRDETLANAKAIVDATHLPVAADLENGFGHAPEAAAETIRLAAKWPGWWADRSKTPRAIPGGPSTTSITPSSAWRPRSRRPARCGSPSWWWAGPKTSCTAGPIWTTPSAGCKPSKPSGRTSSMRGPDLGRRYPVGVCRGDQTGQCRDGLEECPLFGRGTAALGVRRISVGSALSRAALGAFLRAARRSASPGRSASRSRPCLTPRPSI